MASNDPPHVPATTAVTFPRSICSRDLTRLAEALDGSRDKDIDVFLSIDNELKMGGPASGDTKLFTVRTTSCQKDRLTASVMVMAQTEVEVLKECDAFFWSESAVEKFVWPYYTSIHCDPLDIAKVKKLWDESPNIIGIAHTWPSRPLTIGLKPTEDIRYAVGLIEGQGEPLTITSVILLTYQQYVARFFT